MPAYNAERYIGESIRSALEQDHQHWELLVINDGSSDSTEAVVKQWCSCDTRIRYFSQTNQGVSSARNRGLLEMKGDFFCFLDADDFLPEQSLSSRLHIFNQDREIMFVDGRVLVKDEHLSVIKDIYTPCFEGNPFSKLTSISSDCFFGPTWMIKKKSGIDYRFRDGMTHVEDLLFYIDIAYEGRYSFTKDPVLIYRSGHDSAMRNLKGLENGYISLYRVVEAEYSASTKDLQYLKYKITRIMFLSHLKQRNIIAAVKSLIKLTSL